MHESVECLESVVHLSVYFRLLSLNCFASWLVVVLSIYHLIASSICRLVLYGTPHNFAVTFTGKYLAMLLAYKLMGGSCAITILILFWLVAQVYLKQSSLEVSLFDNLFCDGCKFPETF